jgi:catechol 2,3-dioxygenase-like lactoylglutathione lyase family enzyme
MSIVPTVCYPVPDLDEGRRFYRELLSFAEIGVHLEERWRTLRRGEMEIGLAEGEPAENCVAHVDVPDLERAAERLREAGVEVGIVLELAGEMRLLDVFDPDRHRIQLARKLQETMCCAQ